MMTKEEYRAIRQSLGTQKAVAARLGVDYHTVQRRESGEIIITQEAEMALLSLVDDSHHACRGGPPDMKKNEN